MQPPFPAHNEIAALLPWYGDTGDSVKILLCRGGEITLSLRLKTALARLARQNATDLKALKAMTARITQHNNFQILPLSPGLVLFPAKIRTPRVPGDPTSAYINFHAIRDVVLGPAAPFRTMIKLQGSHDIPLLWTKPTVDKYCQMCRLAIAQRSESQTTASDLTAIAQKLVEVFYDILSLKQGLP